MPVMEEYPIKLPQLAGAQELAAHLLANMPRDRALRVLVDGHDCVSASGTFVGALIEFALLPHPGNRVVLMNCPGSLYADAGHKCEVNGWQNRVHVGQQELDALRESEQQARVEVSSERIAMFNNDGEEVHRLDFHPPTPTKPRAKDCPSTHEGVHCVHGVAYNEYGRVVADHMHLGWDSKGDRIEWLDAWQMPRMRSPRYTVRSMAVDVLLVFVLLALAFIHLTVAFYGGHKGWDFDTTSRVVNGVAALLLAAILVRYAALSMYADQQAGPEPYVGGQTYV